VSVLDMNHPHTTLRRATAVAIVLVALAAVEARAACNLIPSASKSFRGTLGDVNRPFAAPGDFVEIGASPARCAGASPGFSEDAGDQIVTVVFEPPGGSPRAAFLTATDCGDPEMLAKLAACEATVGAGRVACVQAGPFAATIQLANVDRNGERKIAFRFPDTDTLLQPDADARTASGPATIAVTPLDDPLPCELATTTCADQTGLLACIDTVFAADGSCDPVPAEVFSSFTALPQPNDFQADCFTDEPPCTGLASELRLAVDAAGNLLMPVRWSGVLIRQDDVPVPRLIRATIKSPLPFPVPDAAFLASYTPEGAKLPPIFEPQSDPQIADPDVITLFGSADASYTILRFARRAGICEGGSLDGSACSTDLDCRGGTCPTTCVGGLAADTVCTSDAECTGGGRCGALFTDFRPLSAYGGPLPLRRQAAGSCFLPPHASCAGPGDCPAPGDVCIGAGICQLDPHEPCADDGDCPGDGNACVTYAFEATTAIPLESLTSGSTDVFSFTVNESTRLSDDNGDGDSVDSVVTLRDRVTGLAQAMGAPAGCPGVPGVPTGRAVVRISDPPFRYPAVVTEDDLVAFLESESAEDHCDQSDDFDRSDAILRVFALGGGERTATLSPPHVADTALVVDRGALAISDGLVFYRRPERGPAPSTMVRASVGPGGVEANGGINADFAGAYFGVSADSRFVLFNSTSNNLVGLDTNGLEDAFVHDRLLGTTERVNLSSSGTEGCCSQALQTAISADGRFVAWGSLDPFLVVNDNNDDSDVFVRDRLLGTTERVSLSTGGTEGTDAFPSIVGCDLSAMTPDARFVLFYSEYADLVPNDTNGTNDLFVRDRLLGTTERVSVRDGGAESAWGALWGDISDDGRFVAFTSFDSQIVADDFNFVNDVFVYDRLTQAAERVSVTSFGGEGGGHSGRYGSVRLSADGRFVTFASDAALVPADVNGAVDIYVHDRETGITELASVATGGVPLPTGVAPDQGFGVHASISNDGRFVGWSADDTAQAVPDDDNGQIDAFVYDRQTATTERVSVTATGLQATGGPSWAPVLSTDGSTVAFKSSSPDFTPGDTLGFFDAFVRGPDLSNPALDLFADGAIDDTVLAVFDASAQTATTLCPAGEVAAAAGRAAFLRPESAVGTGACPGGSLNPGADPDTVDEVVQLWESGGPVQSLGLAAAKVALSATHVAALADEAGQGGAILNGDGDADDAVVHVRAIGAGAWTNVGEAADTLEMCGSLVPFITPEAAQNADRSGDADQDDRVLQVWDTADDSLTNTQLGAEDLVCAGGVIAFRSPEATSGAHRNGDGDDTDEILSVYDASTRLVHESGQAVTPCNLPECDPREPYRVLGRTVKFLTFEPDQGDTDLNGDGDAFDLVIQTFNLDTGRTTTIGTVRQGSNPLAGGDTITGDRSVVYVSSGRCVEAVGGFCVSDSECPATTICQDFACALETGVCASQADCAPGSTCTPGGIVPASPDSDADGVPDHLDNCPNTGDADQTDTDGDSVGDPCDVTTCGNASQEGTEICDGADSAGCPGGCTASCTCCTAVADLKASVLVKTRREAGVLVARMAIPLDGYGGEPVTVRFSDSDPIAAADVGPLPPKGTKGTKWLFKTKTPGLQLVSLKDDTAKHPGMFKLTLRAKEWFTAAQANQPAASSLLQVTIGDQCFGHPVTKKRE
jgi:hypothetical protein